MKNDSKNRMNYFGASVSVVINLILFILKYWAGIVSGSVALIADAWHTLSDSISSIIVIFGVKLSSKKPDKQHPFGHGRWEHIASIFIAVLLAIVAYEFLSEAISRFVKEESASFGLIAIIVTLISLLFKEALAQMSFYIARKTNNTAMKADAWHHRSDALSSVLVLVGIFLQDYIWWVDSVLGVIIAMFLFYAVIKILREAISKLIGEDISEELKSDIKELIVNMYNNDFSVHHFHLHNYGDHKELTFHIKLRDDLNIKEAHDIAYQIELKIKESFNITATIHIEPASLH